MLPPAHCSDLSSLCCLLQISVFRVNVATPRVHIGIGQSTFVSSACVAGPRLCRCVPLSLSLCQSRRRTCRFKADCVTARGDQCSSGGAEYPESEHHSAAVGSVVLADPSTGCVAVRVMEKARVRRGWGHGWVGRGQGPDPRAPGPRGQGKPGAGGSPPPRGGGGSGAGGPNEVTPGEEGDDQERAARARTPIAYWNLAFGKLWLNGCIVHLLVCRNGCMRLRA